MQVLAKRTQATKLPLRPAIYMKFNKYGKNGLGNDCLASQMAGKMRIKLTMHKNQIAYQCKYNPPVILGCMNSYVDMEQVCLLCRG